MVFVFLFLTLSHYWAYTQKVKVAQSCLALWYPMDLYPWDSPGQNTGVSSCSFSRGSSWPRDHTGGSCIAGGFFTSWATREAHTPRVNHNSKRCMFTAAQFTTARTWKQTKHPSAEQWIEKAWYMYTVGFYSAIKKNKTGSFVKTWMGLYRLSYRANYFFFPAELFSEFLRQQHQLGCAPLLGGLFIYQWWELCSQFLIPVT